MALLHRVHVQCICFGDAEGRISEKRQVTLDTRNVWVQECYQNYLVPPRLLELNTSQDFTLVCIHYSHLTHCAYFEHVPTQL